MIYDSFSISNKSAVKDIFFTSFLLFCLCASVFSQQKIMGYVTGINDASLEGVTVIVKGSSTGTSTDDKGLFSILAKRGDVLVFSFVGYNSKQITIGAEFNLKIA